MEIKYNDAFKKKRKKKRFITTFIVIYVNVTISNDNNFMISCPALWIKTHLCAGTTQP